MYIPFDKIVAKIPFFHSFCYYIIGGVYIVYNLHMNISCLIVDDDEKFMLFSNEYS